MNCKPGDLAVIVKPGRTAMNLGRIVIVVDEFEPGVWWCESASGPLHVTDDHYVQEGQIADHRLRPLRNPGDDATDETLLWLPVPSEPVKTFAAIHEQTQAEARDILRGDK